MHGFQVSLAGWFAAGFLGGLHCLGMCGGFAAALGLQSFGGRRLTLLTAANIGRLCTYAAIGTLLGGLSSTVAWLPQALILQTALYLLSLVLIILLGLYLSGLSPLLTRLEALGGPLWRILQPYFVRLVPLKGIGPAFGAGALWGWLPCGLVYSAATGALASGSAWRGGATMLAFGLGTLPNLLAMGFAAGRLDHWRRDARIRGVAGLLLCGYGVVELAAYFMRHGLSVGH